MDIESSMWIGSTTCPGWDFGSSVEAESKVIHRDCLELTRLLLKLGAKINSKNRYGYTPMCLAAERGNTELVKYLAKRGARINHKTVLGNTPLFLAARKLQRRAAFTLKELKAGMTDADLVRAWMNDGPPVFNLMHDLGVDFRLKVGIAQTSLHWAAWGGNIEAATWLMDHNIWDVNIKRSDNTTPLHWAAFRGHIKMCELLLERGAELNAKNKFQNTPLDMAQLKGQFQVAEFLTSRGAVSKPPALPAPSQSDSGDEEL